MHTLSVCCPCPAGQAQPGTHTLSVCLSQIDSVNYYYTTYVHVSVSEKIIKIENSLLVIFDKIFLKSLYYSTGSLANFLSNYKNS